MELWHPSGRRISLAGLWLLLFSAHDNQPYREISLSGHFTTARGYFLLGSDRLVPAPSLRLPPNTIQNGPDAVALYRSPDGPPSSLRPGVPTAGLLDAVVYRLKGSDKEARTLSDALTPGQLPLLEDASALAGDEGLSRCGGLHPADLSAFAVRKPSFMRSFITATVCPLSQLQSVLYHCYATVCPLSQLQSILYHSYSLSFITATVYPLSQLQSVLYHCYCLSFITATVCPLSLLLSVLYHCYCLSFITVTSLLLSVLHLSVRLHAQFNESIYSQPCRTGQLQLSNCRA